MKRKIKTLSEAALQTHVAKLLTAYGRPEIAWFACPNGEQRAAKTGQNLKQQGVKAGAPDLCFIIDGRFIGLELKTEVGTLSSKQNDFGEAIQRAGGRYAVAFGLSEAIAALIDINAFRPNIHVSTAKLLNTSEA